MWVVNYAELQTAAGGNQMQQRELEILVHPKTQKKICIKNDDAGKLNYYIWATAAGVYMLFHCRVV